MQNINRVIMTANLTRDPELVNTSGGTSVCRMRVACNGRIKQQGEWVDKANYFDVTCFGAQADNAKKYLAKGRPVAIDGRLDWREWTADDGSKRQGVQIIAESIQFLSDGQRDDNGARSDAAPVSTPADDDDIPFLWRPSTWEDRYHSNR